MLWRDITRGDEQVVAALDTLALLDADILALQGFDWDLDGAALAAFAEAAGYPHWFAARPNAGRQTGLDMDGDGRLAEPEDALGFGAFTGQSGMAVLSRHPIGEVTEYTDLLWRDLPGALLPEPTEPWPSPEVHAAVPLSSIAHWAVPVQTPDGVLTVLTWHASPPVFDGPEDRNGRRNHDENTFWLHWMDGAFGQVPEAFVLAGNANLDPAKSDGRREAIHALLVDPRLQDPVQDPTVDWSDIGLGRLRVSYVLPSRALTVTRAGTLPFDPVASRHRPVWVDLRLP